VPRLAFNLTASSSPDKANDETALMGGLSKPAFLGIFGPLDCCMTGIVNAATAHSKLEMKEVARVVREKWEELTEAIASAERDLWIEPGVLRSARRAARRSAVFAISSTPEKKNARVGIGKMQAAIDQVDGPERAILMLDLQRIVRKAYKTARKADVEFPARLCPDPDDAEAWCKWMDEINDYLVATGHRRGKKRKANVTA
jgi:hypothetical protein